MGNRKKGLASIGNDDTLLEHDSVYVINPTKICFEVSFDYFLLDDSLF